MNLFFLPPFHQLKQETIVAATSSTVVVAVRLKDFSLLQEIQMSERIKQLEGWSKYMNPILKVSDINIASLHNLEYKIMKKEKQYSLVEKTKYNSFIQEIKRTANNNKKERFMKVLQYYHSFLPLLDFLERNSVVSLSCEIQHIYLDKDGQPILCPDLFPVLPDNMYYLPISAHVLNEYNNKSISSNNIYEICSHFIAGLDELHLFSKEYLNEYAKICIFSLKPYINKQFTEKELTPDVNQFSISIMFLILIKYFFELDVDVSTDVSTWIILFRKQLLDNIMQNKKHCRFI